MTVADIFKKKRSEEDMRAVGREKQLLENQFCREEKRDGGSLWCSSNAAADCSSEGRAEHTLAWIPNPINRCDTASKGKL